MASYTTIVTSSLGKVESLQIPLQNPEKGQVLIKVSFSSLTPFDLYVADRGLFVQDYPQAFGLNASGIVEKVGSGIDDLKIGDRVTAFSYIPQYKGLQQYSIQPRSVVAKIPNNISLEEASTIPDNFVTAFYTLFNKLSLAIPSEFPATAPPPDAEQAILIYGAGATTGQYAIQLLSLSGYKNIIAVASKKHDGYLRSLGATHTIDYHSPTFVEEVAAAAGGDRQVALVMDCVALEDSLTALSKVISPTGSIGYLLPIKRGSSLAGESDFLFEVPEHIKFPTSTKLIAVDTFNFQKDKRFGDTLMPKLLPDLLKEGRIIPNRIRLLDQGTLEERAITAFDLLRNNKISGEKLVIKID